jgi:hypothetical protein
MIFVSSLSLKRQRRTFVESTPDSLARSLCTTASRDISKLNNAIQAFWLIAVFLAIFRAKLVLPRLVLAARTIKSVLCNPPRKSSKAVKPVRMWGISPALSAVAGPPPSKY